MIRKDALQDLPSGPADQKESATAVVSVGGEMASVIWSHWAWELTEGLALRGKIEAVEAELESIEGEVPQLESAHVNCEKDLGNYQKEAKEAAKELERCNARHSVVKAKVERVVPSLEEARKQVATLNRADLEFVSRNREPAYSIRQTIEMLHLLLHCCSVNIEAKIEWATCCRLLAREDLFSAMLNFDTEMLVDEWHVVDFIDSEYLGGMDLESLGGGAGAEERTKTPGRPPLKRGASLPTGIGMGSPKERQIATEEVKEERRKCLFPPIVRAETLNSGRMQLPSFSRSFTSKMQQSSLPKLTVSAVAEVSHTAGVLFRWCACQIQHAKVLKSNAALLDEAKVLQQKARALARQAETVGLGCAKAAEETRKAASDLARARERVARAKSELEMLREEGELYVAAEEEKERRRKEATEEEERRRRAEEEEAERRRREAEAEAEAEAERRRREEEEQERWRLKEEAEEATRRRRAEEEEKRRAAEAEEARRREEEAQRRAEEKEAKRLEREAEERRKKEELARKKAEEAARKEEEEQKKRAEEEEKKRKEELRKRKQQEERQRMIAERKQRDEEKKEEEARRKEEEAAKKKGEEERRKERVEELRRRKEEERKEAERRKAEEEARKRETKEEAKRRKEREEEERKERERRAKQEEEERLKQEEARKKKKEEEERKAKELEEKRKREEEERRRREEEERRRREVEEEEARREAEEEAAERRREEEERKKRECIHCGKQVSRVEPSFHREEGIIHVKCQKLYEGVEPSVDVTEVKVQVTQRIEFKSGEAEIAPVFLSALEGVIRMAKDNPEMKLMIEGHSDQNEVSSVSEDRAESVRKYLISRGIQAQRLRAGGYGADFAGEEGRRGGAGAAGGAAAKGKKGKKGAAVTGHNRRVTFSVIQEMKLDGIVHFGPMSARITPESHPLLEKVIQVLEGRKHLHVCIEGHTCSAPSWGQTNQELSDERANSVVEYLASRGVDPTRLVAKGWGESLPIASNSNSHDKQRNRRVEFHVLGRESQRGLRQILSDPDSRNRISRDPAAISGLQSIAQGDNGASCLHVRKAAAEVLSACGADWQEQRLVWLGATKGEGASLLSKLNKDCVHHVCKWLFMVKGREGRDSGEAGAEEQKEEVFGNFLR